MNKQQEEIEIDLRELLLVIRKKLWIVIIATVLGGGIVGAFSYFFITPTYSATSKLYVMSKSTSITSLADIQIGTSLTQDYMEMITSRPVVNMVIENLELDLTYDEMVKKVKIENRSNTRILSIIVTDADAKLAKNITDEFAEISQKYISSIMKTDPPSIVEYGYVDDKPISPNNRKNALIGALIGALVSISVIIVIYLLDDTVKVADDVEKYLGLNILAAVPFMDANAKGKNKEPEQTAVLEKKTPKKLQGKMLEIKNPTQQDYGRREALNSLRTNLQFCGDDKKVILLTSCTPNEGKSTITIELARSLCENGKTAVLIDADLRKSVLVGRYHLEAEDGTIKGLSHYLSGQAELKDVLYNTNVDGMSMIIAGPVVPNPTELLGKERFKELLASLREKYDMVLVDCPPLGSVIDAAIVAPACDGSVIVVESGAISYRFLQDIKKQLEMTTCPIQGVILNKIKIGRGSAYKGYYKGYYQKYGKYEKYE